MHEHKFIDEKKIELLLNKTSEMKKIHLWEKDKITFKQDKLDERVEIKFIHNNNLQKILEKLSKLRKSCNHKQNMNRICNEKLHYILQQLPT